MAKKLVKKTARKRAKVNPKQPVTQEIADTCSGTLAPESDYDRGYRHGADRATTTNPLLRNVDQRIRLIAELEEQDRAIGDKRAQLNVMIALRDRNLNDLKNMEAVIARELKHGNFL